MDTLSRSQPYCIAYLTDSDTIKKYWHWPDTDTDTRIGAALLCIGHNLCIGKVKFQDAGNIFLLKI